MEREKLVFSFESKERKFKIDANEVGVNINTIPYTSFGERLLHTVNSFEQKTWENELNGVNTGFEAFNDAFQNGLTPGFYMIAGDSHLGKSSFVSQLVWQMIKFNEDIFIMDFSLDDPLDDKISRLVSSWVQVNSSYVKFPKRADEEAFERRKLGLSYLAASKDKYMPYDSNFGNGIEKIIAEIDSAKLEILSIKPKTKFVVIIDSFHDLFIESKSNLAETPKYNELARICADLAITRDLILICTGEIRKPKDYSTRPYVDLIRDSTKIKFEAKAIILLYNDVFYNGSNADIYYNQNGSSEKYPVLEIDIKKNKISGKRKRLFYYSWSDLCFFKEVDEDISARFNSLI